MEIKDLKTIDIMSYEWFDKVNGNSYFSAILHLNYGLKDVMVIKLPFQYGYDNHYEEQAFKEIKQILNLNKRLCGLSRFCRENNIILRSNKKENCLKKELLNI